MDAQRALIYGQSPLVLEKANPQLTNPQPSMDLREIPARLAEYLAQMGPEAAQKYLSGLEQEHPGIASMVKQQQQVGLGSSAMKPLPEQRPPRRLAESV